MTGRICEVHGEYSASGVCRWCEPETKQMRQNFPAGFTPCRCGEYAWEPSCPPDMREGVIDRVFHSPAQCFKLDADPPEYDWTRGSEIDSPEELARLANVDVAPSGELSEAMVGLLARLPPAPREWTLTPALIEVVTWHTPPANEGWEEIRLDAQHAALRWERVARRWAGKGPTPPVHRMTVDGVVVFDDHCAECRRWRRQVPP